MFSRLCPIKIASLGWVIVCSILLSGCDPITDLLVDCLDDDGPVITPKAVPNPFLNQVYDVRLTASIENEPNDDLFDYAISVSDTLPTGLSSEVFERDIRILGTATELGTFEVDISVVVTDPFFSNQSTTSGTSSGLCRDSTRRTYVMTVVPTT
jgi:hypothetical protein